MYGVTQPQGTAPLWAAAPAWPPHFGTTPSFHLPFTFLSWVTMQTMQSASSVFCAILYIYLESIKDGDSAH